MKPYRIVVYSDLQVHPWQEGERGAGRLDDCLHVFKMVAAVCESVQANMLVFNGDMFESKRQIRSDVMSKTYSALRAIPIYYCVSIAYAQTICT